jgi:hypothetical protein
LRKCKFWLNRGFGHAEWQRNPFASSVYSMEIQSDFDGYAAELGRKDERAGPQSTLLLEW